MNIMDTYVYSANSIGLSFSGILLLLVDIGIKVFIIYALVQVIKACKIYIKKNRNEK